MIELTEVTKEYSKGVAALNGVNLKIDQGEFVFIVGDSGSGKSTLIRLLMKELEPTSGTIVVMVRTWEDYGIGRFQSIGDVLVLYIRISDF